jgi:large subunit ribosomal protein L4
MGAALARWGVEADSKILLILPQKEEMVYLSARNLSKVKLITATQMNVYDVLLADKIVTTQTALAKIQEVYGA